MKTKEPNRTRVPFNTSVLRYQVKKQSSDRPHHPKSQRVYINNSVLKCQVKSFKKQSRPRQQHNSVLRCQVYTYHTAKNTRSAKPGDRVPKALKKQEKKQSRALQQKRAKSQVKENKK